MTEPDRAPSRPWAFVPTLYFLQGLPYMLVVTVTNTFFTVMGVSLQSIGHWSTLIMLPWTVKPLWSPVVDLVGKKRTWIVGTQLAIVAGLGGLAFAVTDSNFFMWSIIVCAWVAIWSATHDIAADGFYLIALDTPAQAAFVGVRTASWRLAKLCATGGIVYLAGWLKDERGYSVIAAWQMALAAGAAAYGACLIWNALAMPKPAADGPATGGSGPPFLEALVSYFKQPQIVAVLAFILLFRFGETMLIPMATPFMLKPHAEGGLALSQQQYGVIYSTVGALALIVGGILGGLLISRLGLRRCLWPMVFAMHTPNLLFLWAAIAQPSLVLVGIVVAVEQLGYGFGLAAYTVYLMEVSQKHRFATTHYAISTGLMGLSGMIAGYPTGDLVAAVGFPWFFGIVCLASLPGIATLFFIPIQSRSAAA